MSLITQNTWTIWVLFSAVGTVGLLLWFNNKPSKPWFTAATVLGGLLVISAMVVASSTPNGSDVTDDDSRKEDYVPPVVVDSDVEKLRQWWDSEGVADWPAASVLAEAADIAYLHSRRMFGA